MNTNFENEIWETFLKDAVITHNIGSIPKNKCITIYFYWLYTYYTGVSQSLCKPSN